MIPLELLHGKVVVITGATEGFGAEAARAFCSAGAVLVLATRRDELPGSLARDCEAHGAQALVVPTVPGRRADVQRLAQRDVRAFGRIDVWVNSAGIGALGAFHEVPLADHVQVIETALLRTLYGSYFALRQFQRQGQGIVINLAPVVGRAAAPWYVVGLSAALREELRESGMPDVHVCTVLPGPVDGDGMGVPATEPPWRASPYDPQDVVATIVSLATAPEAEAVIRARPVRVASADPVRNGRVPPEVHPGARRAARAGVPPTLDAARAGTAYTRLESPPA